MNMKSHIVLGLGYGDEGKGLTTDFLCRKSSKPLVIRFSGGHQAGHTVVSESGERHVFSSFGAGSLQGIPTYWSRFCSFFPTGFLNEYESLRQKAPEIVIFVDALASVTTPFDVLFNRTTEKVNAHGSCGLGFGATIQRNTETPYKLFVQDLLYPQVLEQKLKAIGCYYEEKSQGAFKADSIAEEVQLFKEQIIQILPLIQIVREQSFFHQIRQEKSFSDFIFEGSQGILLDMDHGFFPNVTRAHTTSRNAIQLIEVNQLPKPEIYYITRAYQTRHGNGFLSNEDLQLKFTPNPMETNQFNPWQGHQRQSQLDLELLKYALDCDMNYSGLVPKHIVITCLDQIPGSIFATKNQISRPFKTTIDLVNALDFNLLKIYESRSDCSAEIKLIHTTEAAIA